MTSMYDKVYLVLLITTLFPADRWHYNIENGFRAFTERNCSCQCHQTISCLLLCHCQNTVTITVSQLTQFHNKWTLCLRYVLKASNSEKLIILKLLCTMIGIRMNTFNDNSGEPEQDANSALTELDKGKRKLR